MAGSPWSNQAIDLIILTENTAGFSGMFGYSPTVGTGNLIFSVAAAAGTDPYGNDYPQGISGLGEIVVFGASSRILIYSGTPAAGNLTMAIAGSAGTDQFGNTWVAGEQVGITGQGQIIFQPNLGQTVNIGGTTGMLQASVQGITTDTNEQVGSLFGPVLVNPGSSQIMANIETSPIGSTGGMGIVLQSAADDGSTAATISLCSSSVAAGVVTLTSIVDVTPGTITLHSSGSNVTQVSLTSSQTYTTPSNVPSTILCEAFGASGGGGGGGGASVHIGSGGNSSGAGGGSSGGAEYAADPALAVTGTTGYTVVVATGGTAGTAGAGKTDGTNGGTGGNGGAASGNTTFAGNSITVTAHPGAPGNGGQGAIFSGPSATGGTGGTGGTGSSNTTHHNGAAGATGGDGLTLNSGGLGGGGGAGGGSSAGPSANGNAGHAGTNAASGGAGGSGSTAPSGGFNGGAGGSGGGSGANGNNGSAGGTPAGGAGGAGGGGGIGGTSAGNGGTGAVGRRGLIRLTWTNTGTSQSTSWTVNSNGNWVATLPSTYSGAVSTASSSVSAVTVTASSSTILSASWTIPSGDAVAGTKYRIKGSGWGTWATSGPQTLQVGPGLTSRTRVETFPAATFSTSQQFEFSFEYNLTVLSTGAPGKCWMSSMFTLSAVGGAHPYTADQITILIGSNTSSTGESFTTSSSNSMGFFVNWGTTTGAPTITCVENTFERIGP